MSAESRQRFALIFAQLQDLRESMRALQEFEEARVRNLRGQQTVDDRGAVHVSFLKLQDDIAQIEEVLATIAEATGDIEKL